MWVRRLIGGLLATVIALGLAIAAFLTQDSWRPWLFPAPPEKAAEEEHHGHAHGERVILSPEARDNLKLVVKPLAVQTYWRSLQVPGVIVDRPGLSDRGVTAPVAAVVARVHAFPGHTVKPGEPLFTLRLISEYLQTAQAELFKTTQETKITQEKIDRIRPSVTSGGLSEQTLIDLQSQQRRLAAQVQSYRQQLLTRGLSPEHVEEAAQGKFVKEITIATPRPVPEATVLVSKSSAAGLGGSGSDYAYEMQSMRVQLGEQVQAGQVLCVLANHNLLYIEGRGFKKEAPLLERAAQQGWAVEAEFAEDEPRVWPSLDQTLQIRYLANTVDLESRTFGFYIPLTNQSRAYEKDGQTFLVWRFRPGQRVRVRVPVEEFKDVLVLPTAAVAKEGPEAYVFRQNGKAFDRKPVHILFEDRRNVVIAGEEVAPGQYVAQNGAAALNRVLKAQQSAAGGHGHDHAGHSHEH